MRMRVRVGAYSNCPVLLSWIPVTEDSQTSLVAKRTLKEDRPQCCCAISKSFDSSCTRWWNRREPQPTASPYLLPYSHCRASRSCWTVSERFWTLLNARHCFLNTQQLCWLLTTPSLWRLLTYHCVYTQSTKAQLNGMCYVFQYSEQQWTQQGCWHSYTLDSSSECECSHTSTSSHVKLRGFHSTTTDTSFPHSFWDSYTCSYTTPLYSSSTTRL